MLKKIAVIFKYLIIYVKDNVISTLADLSIRKKMASMYRVCAYAFAVRSY
jgi:hypothetical protein